MDFSVSKGNISNEVTVLDTNISQNVDSDIALDEYVEDIASVLNCSITVCIDSAVFSDKRITVEGYSLIRLLYSSENGALHCYENAVPFSRFADADGVTQSDCISVHTQTQYVNCRLINPRRFDVHGNITISVTVTKIATEQTVFAADGSGIQLNCSQRQVSNALAVAGKPFLLSEVLELSSELPAIAQIVNISASPQLSEVRLISGKALLKGEMTVGITYIADSQQGGIVNTEFLLPISQIVEFENTAEGQRSIADVSVSGVEYAVRADSTGKIRLIDTSVHSRAKVSVYSDETVSLVTDAYSTKCNTNNTLKSVELRTLTEQFTDTFLCSSAVPFSAGNVREVLSLSVRDIECSSQKREGRLIFSGTLRAGLTVRYANDEIGFIEKQLSFEYPRAVSPADIICEKSVRVNASTCIVTSPESVEVRIELEISASVFEISRQMLISDIELDESTPKAVPTGAITLYYPDGNESVWEIAKKYNTTVEAIERENSLENGNIQSGSMLILPRM